MNGIQSIRFGTRQGKPVQPQKDKDKQTKPEHLGVSEKSGLPVVDKTYIPGIGYVLSVDATNLGR